MIVKVEERIVILKKKAELRNKEKKAELRNKEKVVGVPNSLAVNKNEATLKNYKKLRSIIDAAPNREISLRDGIILILGLVGTGLSVAGAVILINKLNNAPIFDDTVGNVPMPAFDERFKRNNTKTGLINM